uniref:Uncharacterized protein n=1 Tax=Leptocylindrus danicus TaxID=163516 RepID=A0A7S2LDI9_9STRA|mmetsp:Transcript_4270/g.6226  ORF Transcript_4270/g.6226 Transcript_4270/m.6226 type:complete len:195 (+) Transcript_4270:135-719(+)
MSESKRISILQNAACDMFSCVRDTICEKHPDDDAVSITSSTCAVATGVEEHPYHLLPHNSSGKKNNVIVHNLQQHVKNHESERSLPYRVIALVLALGRRPDNKARAVMLRGIMERVKSHPEEAMMSADDDDSLSLLAEKHIMNAKFSNCLPLHILVTILFDVTVKVFQSVIQAFPAAVSLRRGPGRQTPLGILC